MNSGNPQIDEARALVNAGRFDEAFALFALLLVRSQNDINVRSEFGHFLKNAVSLRPGPDVDRILTKALEEAWIRPDDLALPVIRYLAAKWPRAFDGVATQSQQQLLELLRDPVLLTLLRMTTMLTPGIETLLARFRFSALRAVAAGQDLSAFFPTLLAIAIRGWHSHYALTLPATERHIKDFETEAGLVQQVETSLSNPELDGSALTAALVIIACYQLPNPDRTAAAAAQGDQIAEALERRVTAPFLRQRKIASDLVAKTTRDPANDVLVGQYEAHPYPAWVAEPGDAVALPPEALAALEGSVRSVLIAGCGTGQHALAAARTWPDAKLLAIDLSRTSLAYALDKKDDAALSNIEFALADLLEVGSLGKSFDVIEAMGVLHHLDDPQAGLKALVDVLAPGGIIGIALYASAARSWLEDIRQEYGVSSVETDDDVRKFRAWALAQPHLEKLHYSQDFYSIGGCRDAVFHVREHDYSIADLTTLLEKAGLELIALQRPGAQLEDFPDATDLDGWAALEKARPDLFITMYELWARRKTA